MTRDFLKQAGVPDEAIDKIMAENGKDIEKEKAKAQAAAGELDTLKTEKKQLEDKISELEAKSGEGDKFKSELEELKNKIAEERKAAEEAAADEELTKAIETAFGEAKFSSEYARSGAIADMKAALSKPENKGKGYSELFEALKAEKPDMMANPNQITKMGGAAGATSELSADAIRAVMGLPPEKEKG